MTPFISPLSILSNQFSVAIAYSRLRGYRLHQFAVRLITLFSNFTETKGLFIQGLALKELFSKTNSVADETETLFINHLRDISLF